MKQLSIAQCSGNPTYWNTSYDKEKYLPDHKSLISSLNTLLNKEHKFLLIAKLLPSVLRTVTIVSHRM
jgi:hypothetical protein